jgi:hypothetical protein
MFEPRNNGIIVEVVSLYETNFFGTVWDVKHRMPMLADSGPNRGKWITEGLIYDENLRPISGVPVHDEQLNEVTA